MATDKQKPSLVVIVGPTASGKTDLALQIAKEFDGEIIAADSRTIYKGANIGTAKPTTADQKKIKHWGLDLIEPGEQFSAKQFKDYATAVTTDIKQRGKLPILVGGTGLYIDSLIFDFRFRPTAKAGVRAKLEAQSTRQLQQTITKLGLPMPENRQNRRHLIRSIESEGAIAGRRLKPINGVLIIGLRPEKELLAARINQRAGKMFKRGIVAETRQLIQKHGEPAVGQVGIIYSVCIDLLKRGINRQEAIELFKTRDRQYAKRQLTWFKRNPFIIWCETPEQAKRAIAERLNN